MNRLTTFIGIDNKVGTTMTAQSFAELIASENPDKRVVFLALNGKDSIDYLPDGTSSIDTIRRRIETKLLIKDNLADYLTKVDSIYALGGPAREELARSYTKEISEYLISVALELFDSVVIDGGNDISLSLSIGAIINSKNTVMILEQRESNLRRYIKKKAILDKLNVEPQHFLLNRYYKKDHYTKKYIADRLFIQESKIITLSESDFGREAESERRTLLGFRDENFVKDLREICRVLA